MIRLVRVPIHVLFDDSHYKSSFDILTNFLLLTTSH